MDEGLVNYLNSISGLEQKSWYSSEVYLRKGLGLKTMPDDILEKLRTNQCTENEEKQIKGSTANYEILQNPLYIEMFQYQTIEMRNEPSDFEICDMVDRLLHLSAFN